MFPPISGRSSIFSSILNLCSKHNLPTSLFLLLSSSSTPTPTSCYYPISTVPFHYEDFLHVTSITRSFGPHLATLPELAMCLELISKVDLEIVPTPLSSTKEPQPRVNKKKTPKKGQTFEKYFKNKKL